MSLCQSSVDYGNKNNQYALVPSKTELGCPSGGGIKNGHIRYPSSYGGTQKKREEKKHACCTQTWDFSIFTSLGNINIYQIQNVLAAHRQHRISVFSLTLVIPISKRACCTDKMGFHQPWSLHQYQNMLAAHRQHGISPALVTTPISKRACCTHTTSCFTSLGN